MGGPSARTPCADMLLNAAYCGYLTGMRSKDRLIKGAARGARLRGAVRPGPPADADLAGAGRQTGPALGGVPAAQAPLPRALRRLHARPERDRARRSAATCARRAATAASASSRSTRPNRWRHRSSSGGAASNRTRSCAPWCLPRCAAKREGGDPARRKELGGQLERLRELYVMGDLTKDECEMRCQAIGEELERIGPPLDPQIERADAILRDFARFWEVEPKAAERRKLIASFFDRVWQDQGRHRGQATRALPALLPARRRGRPPTHGWQWREQGWGWSNPQEGPQTAWECGRCQKRERRDSNPRPSAPQAGNWVVS